MIRTEPVRSGCISVCSLDLISYVIRIIYIWQYLTYLDILLAKPGYPRYDENTFPVSFPLPFPAVCPMGYLRVPHVIPLFLFRPYYLYYFCCFRAPQVHMPVRVSQAYPSFHPDPVISFLPCCLFIQLFHFNSKEIPYYETLLLSSLCFRRS